LRDPNATTAVIADRDSPNIDFYTAYRLAKGDDPLADGFHGDPERAKEYLVEQLEKAGSKINYDQEFKGMSGKPFEMIFGRAWHLYENKKFDGKKSYAKKDAEAARAWTEELAKYRADSIVPANPIIFDFMKNAEQLGQAEIWIERCKVGDHYVYHKIINFKDDKKGKVAQEFYRNIKTNSDDKKQRGTAHSFTEMASYKDREYQGYWLPGGEEKLIRGKKPIRHSIARRNSAISHYSALGMGEDEFNERTRNFAYESLHKDNFKKYKLENLSLGDKSAQLGIHVDHATEPATFREILPFMAEQFSTGGYTFKVHEDENGIPVSMENGEECLLPSDFFIEDSFRNIEMKTAVDGSSHEYKRLVAYFGGGRELQVLTPVENFVKSFVVPQELYKKLEHTDDDLVGKIYDDWARDKEVSDNEKDLKLKSIQENISGIRSRLEENVVGPEYMDQMKSACYNVQTQKLLKDENRMMANSNKDLEIITILSRMFRREVHNASIREGLEEMIDHVPSDIIINRGDDTLQYKAYAEKVVDYLLTEGVVEVDRYRALKDRINMEAQGHQARVTGQTFTPYMLGLMDTARKLFRGTNNDQALGLGILYLLEQNRKKIETEEIRIPLSDKNAIRQAARDLYSHNLPLIQEDGSFQGKLVADALTVRKVTSNLGILDARVNKSLMNSTHKESDKATIYEGIARVNSYLSRTKSDESSGSN